MIGALATKFIGHPIKRLEDRRLLRGQAAFIDDLRVPDVRHVAFVRSFHPHARFRVDAGAVTAVTGVVGVFTALEFQDTPRVPTVIPHPALRPCRQPLLGTDKVRYVGEAIAAVVADSRYAAEVGAAAVHVEYEPL